jgi:hypothetical protein
VEPGRGTHNSFSLEYSGKFFAWWSPRATPARRTTAARAAQSRTPIARAVRPRSPPTCGWTNSNFRYAMLCATDVNRSHARLGVRVIFPDRSSRIVGGDYANTCHVMGCRDLALQRSYQCLPSPSVSGTPPRSVSASDAFSESALSGHTDRGRGRWEFPVGRS